MEDRKSFKFIYMVAQYHTFSKCLTNIHSFLEQLFTAPHLVVLSTMQGAENTRVDNIDATLPSQTVRLVGEIDTH